MTFQRDKKFSNVGHPKMLLLGICFLSVRWVTQINRAVVEATLSAQEFQGHHEIGKRKTLVLLEPHPTASKMPFSHCSEGICSGTDKGKAEFNPGVQSQFQLRLHCFSSNCPAHFSARSLERGDIYEEYSLWHYSWKPWCQNKKAWVSKGLVMLFTRIIGGRLHIPRILRLGFRRAIMQELCKVCQDWE